MLRIRGKLFWLFVLGMVTGLLSPFYASAEVRTGSCGTNAQWSFDSETNILTVSGTGAVTETIAKYTVDELDADMVEWMPVKKVIISEGITALNCPRGIFGAIESYGQQKIQLELPDTLEMIGAFSFEIYADIVLPKNVKTIAPAAININQETASLTIAEDNPYYCMENGVLFSKDKKTLVRYFDSGSYYKNDDWGDSKAPDENIYVVPDTVTKIAPLAFYDVNNLTGVVLPDKLEILGAGAFYDCDFLKSVKLSDTMKITSITDYDTSAFEGSEYRWRDIDYGDTENKKNLYVQQAALFAGSGYAMDNRAGTFEGTSLSSITIPNSVKYISSNTFFDKYNLQILTCLSKIKFGKDFSGDINLGASQDGMKTLSLFGNNELKIDMPEENQTYQMENGVLYSKDKTILYLVTDYKRKTFTVPKSVKVIANGAFAENKNIEQVIIPGDIESIGENAFAGTNMKSFICQGTIKHIDTAAFLCSELEKVKIHETAQIPDRAFEECEFLTEVDLGSNVREIGFHAFYNCQTLMKITAGGNVVSVGRGAFYNCCELQSVNLGQHVKEIGDGAFCGCDKLSELIVGDEVRISYKHRFCGCKFPALDTFPKQHLIPLLGYRIQKGVMRGKECLQDWIQ